MPVVIVREQVDEAVIADAMRLGAQDVVTLANRSRLQSVVSRELRAYRLERALSTTLSSAREYREQLQRFLEGSADAITHVQEGIIVDANRAWLELFGYSGEDALTGTPLMDLFEPETHPALKGALVACLQGKWTDHALKVQALLSDGSSVPLTLTLAQGELRERAGDARQHSGEQQERRSRPRAAAGACGEERRHDGVPAAALFAQRHSGALRQCHEGRCAPVRVRQAGRLRRDPDHDRRARERGLHRPARRGAARGAHRQRPMRALRRQRLLDSARARHGARRRDLGRERRRTYRRSQLQLRREEPRR